MNVTAAQASAAEQSRRQAALGSAGQVRAQREREMLVLRARHDHLLARITGPVLKALVEAHGPNSEDLWPDCDACPAPPSEHDGDPVPESWPCGVWMFVSDRVEGP